MGIPDINLHPIKMVKLLKGHDDLRVVRSHLRHVFGVPIGALLLLFSLSSGMLSQNSPDSIRVSEVRDNECLPSEPLSGLSQQYQIVIGAEDVLQGCSGVEIYLKAGTLADLFDLLVSQDPRYNWRYQGGVVIFYGRSGSPSIANLHIRHFEARDVSRSQMYSALDDLTEIENWLKANDCERGELFTIVGGVKEDKEQFSLVADDISLRELLSRMAAATRSYNWAVHQYSDHEGKCRLQIYLGDVLPAGTVRPKL
jgi:hypothetical protein